MRWILTSAALVLVLQVRAPAQSASTNQVGFPAGGVFDSTDFDTINLANGNVHIQRPLFSISGRGKLAAFATYIQDTSGYFFAERTNSLGVISDSVRLEPNATFKGRFAAPGLAYITSHAQQCTGGGGATWTISVNPTLREINGTKHHLVPDVGCGTVPPTGGSGYLYADDASGFVLTPKGTFDKDGIAYDATRESNGNSVTATQTSTTYTDTAGRTFSPTSYTDTLGNTQSILSSASTFGATGTTNLCPYDSNTYDNCSEISVTATTTTLTLPNHQTYTFTTAGPANCGAGTGCYGAAEGQLLSIGLPDGGSISYSYKLEVPSCTSEDFVLWVTKRTVTDGAGASYVTTYPTGTGTLPLCGIAVDDNGNETDTTFNKNAIIPNMGSTQLNLMGGPYPTDILYFKCNSQGITTKGNGQPNGCSGTASDEISLKKVHEDYWTSGGVAPSAITTTLDPSGANQATKKTFTYDQYHDSTANITFTWGNPIDEYVYDYGSGGTPSTTVLRHTNYSYLHLTNSNYVPYNIADRLTSKKIYNGLGILAAETDNTFDGSTPTSITGAINHDDTNYGTSFNYRGNLTTKSECVISGGACGTQLSTTNTFDTTGQLLSVRDPDLHTTTYSYTDSWSAGAPSSGITNAYPTTITYPSTTNTYCNTSTQTHSETKKYVWYTGQVGNATDQNLQTTTFSYADPLLRLTRIDYPDSGAEVHSYVDVTSGIGSEVDIQRRINASSGTPPAVNPTPSATNGWTLSRSLVDGLGRSVRSCTLNPQGFFDVVDSTYDGLNQKTLATAAYNTNSTACPAWAGTAGAGGDSFSYDALGRVTKVTHIDNSSANTSYSGNSTKISDEDSRSRVLQSDALGRLTSVCEVTSASSTACSNGSGTNNGWLTSYSYDALGNLTQAQQTTNTGASRTRTFGYDGLSRLTSSNNPESNGTAAATSYGYNSDSLLISKTSPLENQTGNTATVTASYNYDELHRMINRSFNDSTTPANHYCYDVDPDGGTTTLAKGRMTKETNPRGWIKNTAYDAMGRLTTQTRQIDTSNYSSAFQYWYDGNLKQVTGPDGTVVSYCTGSSPCAGTVTPDVQGRPVYASFPGGSMNRVYQLGIASTLGMTITDTYPSAGSLQRVKTTNNRFQPSNIHVTNGGTNLLNLTLAYASACQSANNGNIATQTYTDSSVNNYCYDDLNRVSSVTGNIPESWLYDPYGNITSYTNTSGVATSFTSNLDSYNRLTGGGYTTDAAGNQTFVPQNTNLGITANYTYHFFATGELKDVNSSPSYTYDAHDRRFETTWTQGGNERHFFYLGDSDRVIAELYSGAWTDYAYLGAERIAKITGTTPNYYFGDHLGSTALLTDASGNNTLGAYPHKFTAFGMDQPGVGVPTDRRRYTGKERDAESQLDYFESRYYSANLGRYSSPDLAHKDDITDPFTGQVLVSDAGPIPYANIEDPRSLNQFGYVEENPLRYIDLDGHQMEPAFASGSIKFSDFTQTSNPDILREIDQGRQVMKGAGEIAGGAVTIGAATVATSGAGALLGAMSGAGLLAKGSADIGGALSGTDTRKAGVVVATVSSPSGLLATSAALVSGSKPEAALDLGKKAATVEGLARVPQAVQTLKTGDAAAKLTTMVRLTILANKLLQQVKDSLKSQASSKSSAIGHSSATATQ